MRLWSLSSGKLFTGWLVAIVAWFGSLFAMAESAAGELRRPWQECENLFGSLPEVVKTASASRELFPLFHLECHVYLRGTGWTYLSDYNLTRAVSFYIWVAAAVVGIAMAVALTMRFMIWLWRGKAPAS